MSSSSTGWWSGVLRAALPQWGALANAREAVHGDREASARRRDAMEVAAAAVVRPAAAGAQSGGPEVPRGPLVEVQDLTAHETFRAAAEEVLAGLQERLGLEHWVVAALDRNQQGDTDAVLAEWGGTRAPSSTTGSPGRDDVGAWARAAGRAILAGRAPRVAVHPGDLVDALRTTGLPVAAYVGVPLLTADGTPIGVLCGVSGREQPDGLPSGLTEVERAARLLATLLTAERAVRDRAPVMAEAYALAERDPLTGLVNRRGWQARLAVEEQRCQRHGRPASVLVIDLTAAERPGGAPDRSGHPGPPDELRDAAQLLTAACRSVDVLARPDTGQLAVLAVECSAAPAADLAHRLCELLLDAGLTPAVGVAHRDQQHSLLDAWDEALEQTQHRWRSW